jgi:2-oxoglutarate dehydrogenase E1 component
MQNLDDAGAPFELYNSPLSEVACLGFEYGYSAANPNALVLWEAQYGDFANAGQVIIDSFIASGEAKWGQTSRLTLLLPHGYEGSGPEHSSARIERFLALGAEGNIRIANPTTAAQYFHLLRRQALARPRKPLVVMTPKRYLRMPATRSPVDELTGGRFQEVLADPAEPSEVRRVVLCSGKVAHELLERRDKTSAPAAVVRLEQLYPFAGEAVRAVLDAHPGAELVWAQEEPENMGAWRFVRGRLRRLLGEGAVVRYVGREESGSPASGTQTIHDAEQDDLLTAAFAGLD